MDVHNLSEEDQEMIIAFSLEIVKKATRNIVEFTLCQLLAENKITVVSPPATPTDTEKR